MILLTIGFMGDTQQQTQLVPTDPWFLANPMFDGYFMEDHGGMEVSVSSWG